MEFNTAKAKATCHFKPGRHARWYGNEPTLSAERCTLKPESGFGLLPARMDEMCPQRFAPESYDAAKLALLQDVFDKSWHVLALRFPGRTELEEDQIKEVLAKTIVELSGEGVFDGPELFKRSLKSVLATVGRSR